MYRQWKKKRIPKNVLYMNMDTTRLIGRPRNRWQMSEGGWKIRWWKREEGKCI
jgi:hypothetical protein